MNWIESLLLGIVQGLTEFLPVSSDGHLGLVLRIFDRATGRVPRDKEDLLFIVILHLGTLAAILAHYRREIACGARGLLGTSNVPDPYLRGSVLRIGVLVALATAMLIPDKFVIDWIEKAFTNPYVIGVGFWITAGVLAVTASSLSGGDKGPADTTMLDALLVGFAQMFAPLPGVSRSGLTIAAALALGFRRTWAVQFSLMLAVPAILGATVLELKDRPTMPNDRIAQVIVATIVAGLIGYVAIVWLNRVVRMGRLWYFSVYLFFLGLAVILGFAAVGGTRRGPNAPPPDRTSRALPARSDDRRVPLFGQRVVDRPLGPRPSAA